MDGCEATHELLTDDNWKINGSGVGPILPRSADEHSCEDDANTLRSFIRRQLYSLCSWIGSTSHCVDLHSALLPRMSFQNPELCGWEERIF